MVLLVSPDAVSPHVGRIEIRFCRVKHHAMDGRFGSILVVLNVVVQVASRIDGKDVTMSGVVIERVAVDIEWRLFSSKKKDGTSFGVWRRSFG